MRSANWLAVGVSAALVTVSVAFGQEQDEAPQGAAALVRPHALREPLFKTPEIPPVKPPPRGGYAWAARSHVLGPVAKFRRGRYTMSRIRELKAIRINSTR